MTSTATSSHAPRGRVQFLLLATLFFFPLLVSFGVNYWFPGLRPGGTTNYGQLVQPAQPLPPLQLAHAGAAAPTDETLFQGRWSYIVLASGDCDDACLSALVMSRQVRLVMNEKRSRIQRVLVLADASAVEAVAARLAPEHPDLHVVAETSASPVLHDLLQPPGAALHLSDPLGNWMMVYPALTDTQTDFKGLQKDIKKLLRLSRIG